jgi:hypothetical protein
LLSPVEGILKRQLFDDIRAPVPDVPQLQSLMGSVQQPFLRLFRARHPGRFDVEFGAWREPHINLTPEANVSVPASLIARPDAAPIRVYCYVAVRGERCTVADQLEALRQAQASILSYYEDAYRCDDADVVRSIRPRWFGMTCSFHGTLAGGGALFLFSCKKAK